MSRVGRYVIARPTLRTGPFRQAVVFIYEDSRLGTVGVNLTNPTTMTLRDVDSLKEVDYQGEDPVVYWGGPVNERAVIMLHTEDFSSTNTLRTGAGLDVSSDSLMIDKLFVGNWPRNFRIVAGASVWAPGQLDEEFDKDLWLDADLDSDKVFEIDGSTLWNWAIEQASSQIIARYI